MTINVSILCCVISYCVYIVAWLYMEVRLYGSMLVLKYARMLVLRVDETHPQ